MQSSSHNIIIRKPDDWHLHLREGDILKKVLKYSAKNFSRALIMPNLKKPILTYVQAEKYKREILKYLPKSSKFKSGHLRKIQTLVTKS